MLNLLWFVANGHLVQYDAIGPHVYFCRNPGVIFHFWSLVILGSYEDLHVTGLILWPHNMTESKVANFGHWAFFCFLLCIIIAVLFLLDDKNIIYLDICVNHAVLVHIINSIQDILGPYF